MPLLTSILLVKHQEGESLARGHMLRSGAAPGFRGGLCCLRGERQWSRMPHMDPALSSATPSFVTLNKVLSFSVLQIFTRK